MRKIALAVLAGCLALGSVPFAGAEPSERTRTFTYNGSLFFNIDGMYVNGFGAWFEPELFPFEDSVTVTIADASGRPVAGVITRFPDFTGEYVLFCGTATISIAWSDEEMQQVYVNPVAGDGPAGCETSVPTRGTVTVTIRNPAGSA